MFEVGDYVQYYYCTGHTALEVLPNSLGVITDISKKISVQWLDRSITTDYELNPQCLKKIIVSEDEVIMVALSALGES